MPFSYPLLSADGPRLIERGRIIPTTANNQMGAMLAKWLGVDDSDLPIIFPGIENFSSRTLGFEWLATTDLHGAGHGGVLQPLRARAKASAKALLAGGRLVCCGLPAEPGRASRAPRAPA